MQIILASLVAFRLVARQRTAWERKYAYIIAARKPREGPENMKEPERKRPKSRHHPWVSTTGLLSTRSVAIISPKCQQVRISLMN